MEVLVIGNGGREHALAWKLKQSPKVSKIYVAPGNAGTQDVGINLNIKTGEEILHWLMESSVSLVVVGPDKFLQEGLVDAIQKLGIPVFGPTRAAAEIEWSKSYAKQFMEEEEIPTAKHKTFTSGNKARKYIRQQKFPLVIKADGLAAGKGVVIAQDLSEADNAISQMLDEKLLGDSGSRILIEEYLDGFEISTHAFCSGEKALMFPSSKDHKRIYEHDLGPNTGGMGTIASVPSVSEAQLEEIKEKIILPTLRGLKQRGREFSGVLFPGIMITKDGPKVIEFNARFGDPETQSYMLLLESDLFEILYACAGGGIDMPEISWSGDYACCVILAAKGYPANPEKGATITILPHGPKDVLLFHAGTTQNEGLFVEGGRVLGVAARDKTLQEALNKVYLKIEQIDFNGKQFRKDIGASVLK